MLPVGSTQMPNTCGTTALDPAIPRVDRSRRRARAVDPSGITLMSGAPTAPAVQTGGSASINQVHIAPVAATGGMMSVLPVQLSAALLGAMPARFSGEPEDWPEWKRRWLTFLENVEEAMPQITDA